MFEKNLGISFLLGFYGDVLSEHRRNVMDMYYNEDLSLAEISAEVGISRQGVRDLIKKSEEELTELESKLKLAEKFVRMQNNAARIESLTSECDLPAPLANELKALINELKNE